jgi:hypothetical protein
MNCQSLLELFAVAGKLLGDTVTNATDRDIGVVRIQPVSPSDIQQDGCTYTYLHDAVLSFDGVLLGNARVYWSGQNDNWQELAHDRMKEILHRLNYRVLFPRYSPDSETLRRLLLASAPRGNLIIAESLFIRPIETTLSGAFRYKTMTFVRVDALGEA